MRIIQSLREKLHLFNGPVSLKRDPAKTEELIFVDYSPRKLSLSRLQEWIVALGHTNTKNYATISTNDINSEPPNKTNVTIELPTPASELDAHYRRYVKRWLEYCQKRGRDYERILWIAPDASGNTLLRLFKEGRYRELYFYKDSLPYGNEM